MTGERGLRWAVWVSAYAVLTWFGLQLMIPPDDIAAFWPASGVGVAAAFWFLNREHSRLLAYSVVPVAYLITAVPVRGVQWVVVGYMLANTVEAVFAAELLNRYWARRGPGHPVNRIAFIAVAVAAPLASALVAAVAHEITTGSTFALSSFYTWWLADSIGFIAIAPALIGLVATRQLWPQWTDFRRLEVTFITLLLLVSVVQLFFNQQITYLWPGVFTTVWWALRFGFGPTSIITATFSTAVATASARGVGPFVGESALVLTQLFVITYSVSSLAIASVADRQRAALHLARAKEKQLERALTHDPLTNLPWRSEVVRHLEQQDSSLRIAVAVLDIDNLSVINDRFGRTLGDQLIEVLGQRFLVTKRYEDHLARLGGDEFLLVMEDVTDEEEAQRIVNSLLDGLLLPVDVTRDGLAVTVSAGVTVGSVAELEALMRDVDFALHEAKSAGRNRVHLRTDRQRRESAMRQELAERLVSAIDDGELFCHFQPICPTGASAPGAEALVRWHHPVHGLLSPAVFLPAQERAAQMHVLGSFVLRTALAQVRAWRDQRDPDLPRWVSVNVSPGELARGDLHTRTLTALRENDVDPHALVVELTEDAMVSMDSSTRYQLEALREAGVRVAIDDFGTGYSSLAYLSRLPIDVLKLDGAFIGSQALDRDRRLVKAICSLACEIGLTTVIEGVETTEQLTAAIAAGADSVQGYLLGRPGPAIDLRTRVVRVEESARSITLSSPRV